MESLLYAGFMQLFFNSKKKKKVESFEKALDFQPVTLYDLGWNLPIRRFTDWVATEDVLRLTFSFEACLDFFPTASGKKSYTPLKTLQLKNIVNYNYLQY